MTVQEEIAKIQEERYVNYKSGLMVNMGKLHGLIRTLEGDEAFLNFLKQSINENPRPVYKSITQFLNQ